VNIEFENLQKIPQVLDILVSMKENIEQGKVEKRWLNTREVSYYLGYKFGTLQSKIKKGDFKKGKHYYKKGGALLFDKIEIDNWVMDNKFSNNISYANEGIDTKTNELLSVFSS